MVCRGWAGGPARKILGFTRVDDVGFCWGLRRFFRRNLHGFRGVNGGLEGEKVELQLEALAGKVGMAELVDFAAKGAEGAEFGAARGVGVAIPAGYGVEIVHGKQLGEVLGPLGGGIGRRDGRDERDRWGGGAGLGEHFAAELPGGEAMGAPFAEVLPADGARGEFSGQDGPDRRQGVEPRQKGTGGLVVGEAVVEFVAQGFGKPGDFRGLSHRLLKAIAGAGTTDFGLGAEAGELRWRQTSLPLRAGESRAITGAVARAGRLHCGGSLTLRA